MAFALSQSAMSHPMRVRGLKLSGIAAAGLEATSHPMRVRGLKLTVEGFGLTSNVAPHAGAWIETIGSEKGYRYLGRTPCGCVD